MEKRAEPTGRDERTNRYGKVQRSDFGKFDFTASAACTSGTKCVNVSHRWLYGKLDKEGSPLYYHAPDSTGLGEIFHTIGNDLTEIHLSKLGGPLFNLAQFLAGRERHH